MPELVDTERSLEHAAHRSCLNDDEVLDFAAGRLQRQLLDALHAHLDHCRACQRLVGEALRGESGSGPTESDPSIVATAFRPGDVIGGRYRVRRFIARGGMGEVYDAYDRDLQKRIALKTVISTVSDSQRATRRLKAEVQLAHRVSHPNVCRIYDLGVHMLEGSNGLVHFLTMEFVEGERLGERLERGALPVSDATDVARQLLMGLRAAHAAGILHRDLKSDNVMLRPGPNGDVVPVILDFGLARTIEVDVTHLTTGANGFVGTPCYMAPEQLEAGELTPASDIYGFGVIWFEMLTGRLPFSVRTPFDRLCKAPPRPSSISPDVPSSVDKIVLKCLERLPENRFGSAEEALDALDSMSAKVSLSHGAPVRRFPSVVAPAVFGVGLGALLIFHRVSAPGDRSPAEPSAAAPARVEARQAPTPQSDVSKSAHDGYGTPSLAASSPTPPTQLAQKTPATKKRQAARPSSESDERATNIQKATTLSPIPQEAQSATLSTAALPPVERPPQDVAAETVASASVVATAPPELASAPAPASNGGSAARGMGFEDPFHRAP